MHIFQSALALANFFEQNLILDIRNLTLFPNLTIFGVLTGFVGFVRLSSRTVPERDIYFGWLHIIYQDLILVVLSSKANPAHFMGLV
jgi:hypothetical protein